MRMSWDRYGLEIAKAASYRSEDPYLQVGACVLRIDRSIISIGYFTIFMVIFSFVKQFFWS